MPAKLVIPKSVPGWGKRAPSTRGFALVRLALRPAQAWPGSNVVSSSCPKRAGIRVFLGPIDDGHGSEMPNRQSSIFSVCSAVWQVHSAHRRKSSAPLVPPKPNELDIAYSTSALRALFGT